jgi:hypothetical protein
LKQALLGCALLSFAACSNISSGVVLPPGQEPAGTWDLLTVNGEEPPAIIADDGAETRELLSATLVLTGQGSTGTLEGEKEIRVTPREGDPTTVTETRSGVWTLVGVNIAVEWDGGCTEAYTVSSNSMIGDDCDIESAVIYTRRN